MRKELANLVYPEIFTHDNDMVKKNEELTTIIGQRQEDIEKITNAFDVLKQENTQLKSVSEFEKYLNGKYQTKVLVYTKRWVKNSPITMDIRDFIQNDWTLPKLTSLNHIFTTNIRYVSDNYAYNGIPDWWQIPQETYVLSAGDCEDSAVYRASLALSAGINEVFVALGFLGSEGHAFNIFWDDGDIYIIENTSNSYKPIKIKSLEDTGTNYRINYIFNRNNAWVIDSSVIFGAKVQETFSIAII